LLNGSNDPSKQSDVWSFAVIVAEMLCRVHPVELMRDQAPSFAGMTTDHTDMKISKDAFMKWVRQGRSCALPDFLPDSLQAMLQKCWLPKPSERPSFANILLRLRRMQIKCRDDESWSKAEKMYEKYQAHFGIKHKNTEHEEEKMNSVLIEDEEKEDSALSTSPFSSSLLTPSIFAAETPTSVDQMSESSLRQALLSKPSVSV
jgi:serine/threonine protein kinase